MFFLLKDEGYKKPLCGEKEVNRYEGNKRR